MRIYAVTAVVIAFLLVIIVCIRALLGKGNILFKGYWFNCTNLKEDNKKQQKYVLRVHGTCGLILSAIVFPALILYIYEQWIAGVTLFCVGVIAMIGIALYFKYNKKYRENKYEISEDKKCIEYCENLKKQNIEDLQSDKSEENL